ncbi:hypothetical protein HHK36_019486 [Tetracentron sinense]|uniref:C2 DOCK-type domain-containing protein n=1 Tax=Tetracentron sinense TaxID=13715 RepID=A0A835D972_TETSI|nr:hypothetical protein HHK36_019486 [Tetracentron sinense]
MDFHLLERSVKEEMSHASTSTAEQGMEEFSSNGHRFRRIPRQPVAANLELHPLLKENLEQWPHLNELVQCYKADWVKDEKKYGHYESIAPISFQNQIFEGPDTDIETEMRLASARHSKTEDATDDDILSTSGRQLPESSLSDTSYSKVLKHFGESPLPAYEAAFDWENERSLIFGQRTLETQPAQYGRERREKLSEDFYFRMLPTAMQDGGLSSEPRGIFSLDAPSASVCLLIQLEKPATEEGGVSPSVYSRKEPVHLTEREKQKLQVWSQIMPYRESFAWAIVPLFDNNNAAASGGAASLSSPLAPSVSGSSSLESVAEPIAKIALDRKLTYSSGSSVIVEISNLNKVKESYTEDSLQDPKRKVHKPVKGVVRLEIERLQSGHVDMDAISENGSITNDSIDTGNQYADATFTKSHSNDSDGPRDCNSKWNSFDGKEVRRNSLNGFPVNYPDSSSYDFQAFDFCTMTRSEPFSQLFHCLYLYPLTVSLSRKSNLYIRVELRKDDADVRKQPLEAMYPRDPGGLLQKWAHTQVAVGARVACYHDEIKLYFPAILTPQQHLLFTFFHIDLQTKLQAPKPVIIGYAALPLSTNAQLRSEISLPIIRELVPHYLQDSGKKRLDYLEDGKHVFRLRLRLCSSLYPINEHIRDFFLQYDMHTLGISPPWRSELLEAIDSLKNADSTALLQFLQPILNMLLHLIGDGCETLQVAAFRVMVHILTRKFRGKRGTLLGEKRANGRGEFISFMALQGRKEGGRIIIPRGLSEAGWRMIQRTLQKFQTHQHSKDQKRKGRLQNHGEGFRKIFWNSSERQAVYQREVYRGFKFHVELKGGESRLVVDQDVGAFQKWSEVVVCSIGGTRSGGRLGSGNKEDWASNT